MTAGIWHEAIVTAQVAETTMIETILYPRVDSAFPRPSAAVQALQGQ